MTERTQTYLLNLPVEDVPTWVPLSVNYANNNAGGKYNIGSLRIATSVDSSAFPMTVEITNIDGQSQTFQDIASVDIAIEGEWELTNLLRAFQQILEAEKVVSIFNKR